MSESQESSYYEIALSNRQVLIMFVLLLSCMVAAFLSGVWVGKKNPLEDQPQLVAATEAAEASTTEELGDLNFFSEHLDTAPLEPPLAQVAAAARPDTTLREEVSRKVQAQSSTASPTSLAAFEEAQDSSPIESTATSSDSSSAAEGPLVIQVFSSKDQTQANRLVERIANGGYPAFMISEDVDGKTVYRVRIGPYPQRSRAEEVAALVQKSFKLDTWITH